MKNITVKYFAMFRENAGMSSEILELDVETAGDVFTATAGTHGSSEPLAHCKVAINDEMADWGDAVKDGDTVLLFPPVAGG